MENNWIDDI